jgi:hypothetical protein
MKNAPTTNNYNQTKPRKQPKQKTKPKPQPPENARIAAVNNKQREKQAF